MSEKLLGPGALASEEKAAPHLTEEEAEWRPATAEELSHPRPRPSAGTGLTKEEEKWPNEWHVICWMLASGSSQRDIARELGYSEGRISVVANKQEVIAKIESIRQTHFGAGLQKRFSQVAPRAMTLMEQVIDGKAAGQTAKVNERVDAAKWVLEKVTGKPTQHLDLDGGGTILQLLGALDKLNLTPGKTPTQEGRDVIEMSKVASDPLDDWVTENVPEAHQEKTAEEKSSE